MPQTYRKKLIEVALPLEAINVASAREKSIRHGHPSTLHLWWARRPLAAARAVIFTSLVDDPDAPDAPTAFVEACMKLPRGKNAAENDTPRQRLFDFIERLVTWEATTDEKILKKARELINLSTDGNPPPLLDPFAGGGSIPLEAQRLGLEAHASDLNPVAVMINKALIEIPPKFANIPPVNPRDRASTSAGGSWKGAAGLAADVRYYGEWMREKAWGHIGHLYPKSNGETVIAWLWVRTVMCPNPACGIQMPLTRSFTLSTKKGNHSWIEPQVEQSTRRINFKVKHAKNGPKPTGTINRNGATCVACNTAVTLDYIRNEGKAGRLNTSLVAIVTKGANGRSYHSPNFHQIKTATDAEFEWKPLGELQGKCRVSVPLYGMNEFSDLFTSRQLATLTTYSDLINEARGKIMMDAVSVGFPDTNIPLRANGIGALAYSEAISVYLAMGVSKLTDYNSELALWSPGRDQAKSTFARQALPMVWDFAEVNPFAKAAGDLTTTLAGMSKTIEKSLPVLGSGVAQQADATNINQDNSVCISTDPPYYDNIEYADLSDYFYVWLRKPLKGIFPELFGTMLVPKSQELVASPFRFMNQPGAATAHFEKGLQQAFTQMQKNIRPEFPLSVYYAFKQEEIIAQDVASTGWETMLNGLITAGFSILGTWPMRTERSSRSIGIGANALASSIILVCRPRLETSPIISRREFINVLRQELPHALREMQTGNIAPVDLAQASIGPGMAVYSRYSKVLEPDGSPLTVRAALEIINHELDSYLAEQEGEMDSDSRFAISWFEQFGFKEGGFGQADVLARAKNTSVEGLAQAGILKSEAGKVSLLHWSDLAQDWDPEKDKRLTVWEITHHLIERLNNSGETGVARLLSKLSPDHAADARQMAYRLYSICERKGWAEHARDYNALVVSWGTSQEQAQGLKDSFKQETMF